MFCSFLRVAGGLSRPVEKTVRGGNQRSRIDQLKEVNGGIPFSGGSFYNYLIVKT